MRVKDTYMVANTGTAPATEPSATDENGVPRYIAVTTSPEFYAAIKEVADKENIAPSTWIKRLVAKEIDFVLTDTPRSKYANEAEKKAAQRNAVVTKAEKVHVLFIEHYTKLAEAGDKDAAAKAAREQKALDKLREKIAAAAKAPATAE